MSSVTFLFLLVSILTVLFLTLNFALAPHNPYQEKYSIFECGFHSFLGQNRTQFGVKFFIFGFLFLIFDLELLLLFPYAMSIYDNSTLGFSFSLLFMLVITAGFAFELGQKALTIPTRQSDKYFHQEKNWINSIGVR